MNIMEKINELEKENYSNEDLLILFEYYIEESNKEYRDKENARYYFLALKKMILGRMAK